MGIAGAAMSTLIFAIGLLVTAIESPNSGNAGNIVAAVGLGGWAVVLVIGAARHSLLEQETPHLPHQAGLRLGASAAIVLIAVGIGLPDPTLDDATLGIATGIIVAAGFGALILVLSLARNRGLITSRFFPILMLGLWLQVLGGLAHSIGIGITYGPPPYSILAFRIALSMPAFVGTLSFLVFGWTAFCRLTELPQLVGQPAEGVTTPNDSESLQVEWPPPPSATVPPSWQSDPTRRHELRWWDGDRWSQHVLDKNQPAIDPLES